MSKFKVGEKIVFYEAGARLVGTLRSINSETQFQIIVEAKNGIYNAFGYLVHPKQCRKLVKKKRHEFWLDFGGITGLHINMSTRGNIPISSAPVDGWTKVRECK